MLTGSADAETMDSEVMSVIPRVQMYTPAQVSALLQLSRTKTYQLIADGEIGSVFIGRCRRVPAADLEAFIHARRAVADTELGAAGN